MRLDRMQKLLQERKQVRKRKSSIPTPPVLPWLLGAWGLFIGISVVLRLMGYELLSTSLLWGVTVCLAPSVMFAWYVFKYRGATRAKDSVNAFYRGESLKFVATAALFALVFTQAERIQIGVFFLSFIIAQLISWLIAVRVIR